MAPHGIYPCAGEDRWIALCCRDDDDWARLAALIDDDWAGDVDRRAVDERRLAAWTAGHDRDALDVQLRASGIPSAPVRTPPERIDGDPTTAAWGLWPTVQHPEIGPMRVEGIPVHLSRTDWRMEHGAPCLGEHNDEVFGGLLGLDVDELRAAGAI
jgi:crotonobetainyl-CoA:carnitine CoA-transferase CaiB-like acyl-CoA transferase